MEAQICVPHESEKRYNFHCWSCGVHKSKAKYHHWLEAHECYSINYNSGRAEYVGTCALCHACHNYIHDGRMLNLLRQNKFTQQLYLDIIEHGNQILYKWLISRKDEKLFDNLKKSPFQGNKPACEKCNEWHLIQKQSSKIQWIFDPNKSEAEWRDYHLIINGVKYEQKFKSFEDWKKFYFAEK